MHERAHDDASAAVHGDPERGSALVLAIFVLVLVAGMGTALLFLSQTEVRMSTADVRGKQAFYLAEAGLEHARQVLWNADPLNESFDDELATAAGDATMDFDVTLLQAPRTASGTVSSISGYSNDVPLVDLTSISAGQYAAFLTNDPADIALGNDLIDSNDRVMITALGWGRDGSTETVEAIVELREYLPSEPPATITLLGPSPAFGSAKSKVKVYEGEDCGGTGGIPGLYMPIVGAVGSSAVGDAEAGWETNPTYTSGTYSDLDTFADLEDTGEPLVSSALPPSWSDCDFLDGMIRDMCDNADIDCTGGSCSLPTSGYPLVCAKSDLSIGPGSYTGMLVVTGELTMNGNADWAGLILVIGEGSYTLNGAGNGLISGGMVVADIAGSDNVWDTADDCSAGLSAPTFDENGGGNAATQYCTTDLDASIQIPPYTIVEFRQR